MIQESVALSVGAIHRHQWGWRYHMEGAYRDAVGAPLFKTPTPLWSLYFMAEEAGELVGAAGSRKESRFLRSRDVADSEVQELCDYIMMASTYLGPVELPSLSDWPSLDPYFPTALFCLTARLLEASELRSLQEPDNRHLAVQALAMAVAGLSEITRNETLSPFTDRLAYREAVVQAKYRESAPPPAPKEIVG